MDHAQGGSGGTEGEAALKPGRTLLLAAVLAVMANAAAAMAESAERVAALLSVMKADLDRPETPGRQARLLESASLLPIMLREAGADPAEVRLARGLYPQLRRGEARQAALIVAALAARHPFAAPVWVGEEKHALALGAAIHHATCAACHDHPDPGALLPAEDLFALACRESPGSFAARLYLGVKGQADTGFRTPFSARERAALALWYRKGRGGCKP